VLLASKVSDSNLEPFGVIDIEIKRNAFGRQIDSFETELSIPVLGDKAFHGIFIRAPIVEHVAPGVEVLCQLGNNAVAVRQGKIVACAFHPELTQDLRLHKYFRDLITGDVIAKGDN
jgi:5'-phosphate synthase pdxT subunit